VLTLLPQQRSRRDGDLNGQALGVAWVWAVPARTAQVKSPTSGLRRRSANAATVALIQAGTERRAVVADGDKTVVLLCSGQNAQGLRRLAVLPKKDLPQCAGAHGVSLCPSAVARSPTVMARSMGTLFLYFSAEVGDTVRVRLVSFTGSLMALCPLSFEPARSVGTLSRKVSSWPWSLPIPSAQPSCATRERATS
jgi:hypothetical protein